MTARANNADPDTPAADAPADTDLRVDMREAIYYCLTDASMWIGDDGQPLDYLPAREALMGEFLDEAVDALLPLVRAQVEAARRRDAQAFEDGVRQAITWLRAEYPYATGPDWRERGAEWIEARLADYYTRDLAARGETRQP